MHRERPWPLEESVCRRGTPDDLFHPKRTRFRAQTIFRLICERETRAILWEREDLERIGRHYSHVLFAILRLVGHGICVGGALQLERP